MDFWKANYWWIYQIVGCVMIFSSMLVNTKYGLSWISWLYYSVISVLFTSWMFQLAYNYDGGRKFFANWFLSSATLAICGFAGAFYILPKFFNVPASQVGWSNIAGALLIILGSILIFK